jgi:hypothetical protein
VKYECRTTFVSRQILLKTIIYKVSNKTIEIFEKIFFERKSICVFVCVYALISRQKQDKRMCEFYLCVYFYLFFCMYDWPYTRKISFFVILQYNVHECVFAFFFYYFCMIDRTPENFNFITQVLFVFSNFCKNDWL